MILAVAIDTPLRRTFDYRAPAGQPDLAPGQRVWVPFGRRRVVGVIVGHRDRTDVPAGKLRSVIAPVDAEPTFDPALLQLLLWSADYYRHPVGEVLAAALPAPLRSGAALREETIVWSLTELGQREALAQLKPRAVRLRAIVEALVRAGEMTAADLQSAAESTPDALRKLEARGYVQQEKRTPERESVQSAPRAGPTLNDAQRQAVQRITGTLGSFASHLLYGVTGSGKTEVYLRSIAAVIERREQALVLVPEIALTPQLIARFRARFDTPLAVLHSNLSDGERLAAWRSAGEGTASIVIGTRSAVFSPLARAGLIVVDEEHDASFKQQEGFRYSARDLAIVRAQRLGIPVVLGSATPSLETLHRAQRQPQWLSRLPQRAAANAQPPRMALIDLRAHAETQGIATPVVFAIRRHLDADGQVMLFLNRRGYAPVLFCPACGWAAHCKRCDAHLTVHSRAHYLICHHCGSQQPIPELCANCGQPAKPVGQGTERIEETVRQLFPDAPLARIDRDAVRRRGELEATLARVDSKEVRILIGTQMLTKGHDFPNVTLVVVLNADQGLFSTDFRAGERLAQTIVQVAGRAGRAERPGEVLIQTEYPDHPLLKLLLEGGYEAFAGGALQEREQSQWPPFARIALLRAEAATALAPMKFLRAALAAAQRHTLRGVQLLGPAPAPMERRAGRYRAQVLLHAATHSPLQKFMSAWLPELEALPEARRVRWSIDVDALDLG
ncbi:MAG TPA: primosomal protein N' [Steroidobacteraceae bacterium]|nr:primosomal protein N' [Steroidobacteraceae bacterium]